MKTIHLLFAICLIFFTLEGYAQKRSVKNALRSLNDNELDEAKKEIDAAIDGVDDEKTLDWSQTWYVRGLVYQALLESNQPRLSDLETAQHAYLKALELGKKEYADKRSDYDDAEFIINHLRTLCEHFLNYSDQQMQKKKYAKALELLEKRIETMAIEEINKVDTASLFKAGLIALKIPDETKAINFFNKAIDYGYNQAQPYLYKARVYKKQGKTNEMEVTLKRGIEKYPDDSGLLLIELIDYYINKNKTKEIQSYIEGLQKKHPNSATLISSLGILYEETGQHEKAKRACDKAVQMNPSIFITNYNAGVIHYSEAVRYLYQDDKLGKPIQHTGTAAKESFSTALPYFEKALEIVPLQTDAMKKLITVYRRLELYTKSMQTKKLYDELTK